MCQKDIDELQKKVKDTLSHKRYIHSIGVRYTASCLAMRYGEDLYQASCAGILHDCAKNLDDDEMLLECKKNSVKCTDIELKAPYLLHAKLGAVYAKKDYDIDDKSVLSAIRWHTTGKEDMTLLEKIIFTADYIEPHRKKIEQLDAIRQMAFTDLDIAVYMILKNTINYLESDRYKDDSKKIDKHTIDAYDYYKELIGSRRF